MRLFTSNKSAHNLVDFDNTILSSKIIEVDFPCTAYICLLHSSNNARWEGDSRSSETCIIFSHFKEKIEPSTDLFDVHFYSNYVYVREILKQCD